MKQIAAILGISILLAGCKPEWKTGEPFPFRDAAKPTKAEFKRFKKSPPDSAARYLGLVYAIDLSPVEIVFAPDGNFSSDLVESNVCQISNFTDLTGDCIRNLPAAGSVDIDIPTGTLQWKVRVTDENRRTATLFIVGDRLCAPDSRKGRFYAPQPEAEKQFISLMKSLKTFRKKDNPNKASEATSEPAPQGNCGVD